MPELAQEGDQRAPSRRDVAVAGSMIVACLLPFLVARGSQMLSLDPAAPSVALAVAGSVALTLRRQRPWATLVVTTVVGLVAVVASGGPNPAYLPAVVALYTVTVRSPRTRAVAAAVVSAVAPVVLILTVGRHGAFDAVAFGMTPWSGIALMSGIAVRNQHAVVAAARERARQAEASLEEEAQSRVTEERLRIARELHDVVAHHVSVINVQAGVASYLVRADPDGAAAALAHVREASQSVLGEVSLMLGLLRSREDELETAPVPRLAEVDALVERVRRSGVRVTLRSTEIPPDLGPLVDSTAYRVLQEALTNAARHGAGSVDVQIAADRRSITVEVRNPLRAADRRAAGPVARTPGSGHGLAGMRERVAAVGGTLTAASDGPTSWLVRMSLPVALDPRPVDVAAEPLAVVPPSLPAR